MRPHPTNALRSASGWKISEAVGAIEPASASVGRQLNWGAKYPLGMPEQSEEERTLQGFCENQQLSCFVVIPKVAYTFHSVSLAL